MTKNKPFPQWVEEIDCPIIKKKVKKNFDRSKDSKFLSMAFKNGWSKSPEGYDYWDRVSSQSFVAKNCYHKDFAHLDESEVTMTNDKPESAELPTTRKQAFVLGLIPCFLFCLASFLMASFVGEPLFAILVSMGYVIGFFGALAIFYKNFPK